MAATVVAICSCASVTSPVGGRLVASPDVPDSVNQWLSDQSKIIGYYTAVSIDKNYRDTVEFPDWAAKRVYNAIAILWSSKSLERDSVFKVYAIRERGLTDFRTVILCDVADSLYIDILNQYHFYVDARWSMQYDATTLCNTGAVANKINQRMLPWRPNCAAPNVLGGGGDHITASFESDAVVLGFRVGYADCPMGCMFHRTWSFRVFDDGTVKFLGVSGNAPPPPNER